jgi:hypothetical protein
MRNAFWIGALMALSAACACAQVPDTGMIVGTVSDSSGAAVPGATVTVTNIATNISQTIQTEPNGEYVAAMLNVGTYAVAVEKAGFKRFVQTGIKVDVQARLEVNVTLQVGQVTQDVQVTAAAPLLDTQSASVGEVVTERAIVDLPLNGRQYDTLVFLTTGVVQAPQLEVGRGEGTFVVDGNTSLQNNFILDGIDNNSYDENMQSRSAQVAQVSVDALSEFKIQTHTYDVSFGRNAGSVVNATIRSGSNKLHGSAWGFLRNRNLDANNYFLNAASTPIPPFDQDQFGGTLGGPIKADHTFFFLGEEHTRIRQSNTLLSTVPTPLMHQYNFMELKTTPTSPSLSALSQFANCIVGGQITSSCPVDQVGAKILALYPLPNTNLAQNGVAHGFVGSNYIASPLISSDTDSPVVRVDTQWHEANKIFAHWAITDLRRDSPGIFGNLAPVYLDGSTDATYGRNATRGTSVALGYTRTVSPTIVDEARIGFNRVASHALQTPFNTPNVSASFGIQGLPNYPASVVGGGLAPFVLTGFANMGSYNYFPQIQYSYVWQYEDTLSIIRGAHTLRFGAGWRRDANRPFDVCCSRGYFNFNGQYTGSAATDLLLGLPVSAGLATLATPTSFNDTTSWFAQDTWRATSKLTFNYGVRYEYVTPRIERLGQVTNFDPTANGGQGAAYTPPPNPSGTAERSLVNPWRKGFAPRIGLAYSITRKLVFRGGAGMFIQGIDRQGSESLLELNPPYFLDTRASIPSTSPPRFLLYQGFPSTELTPYPLTNYTRLKQLSMLRIVSPNLRPAVVENFSSGFEYSISPNLLLDAAWVGNYGHHEWALGNLNQGYFPVPLQASVKPFPNFPILEYKSPIGNATYNALQMRLEKRWSNGLTFVANYTNSKCMADYITNLDVGSGAINGKINFQNWYDRKLDKALSITDVPQSFVLNWSYQFPAGKGKHWLNSGPGRWFLGDWQVNGIYGGSSGVPLGVISPRDTSGTGIMKQNVTRANCIAKPAYNHDGTVKEWFDTSVYAIPATYTFGTCSGSPGVRAPGVNNLDMSLFKNILPSSERYGLQFRVEVFNLVNKAEFAPSDASSAFETVSAPSFGTLTSLLHDPREFQFALKFSF